MLGRACDFALDGQRSFAAVYVLTYTDGPSDSIIPGTTIPISSTGHQYRDLRCTMVRISSPAEAVPMHASSNMALNSITATHMGSNLTQAISR